MPPSLASFHIISPSFPFATLPFPPSLTTPSSQNGGFDFIYGEGFSANTYPSLSVQEQNKCLQQITGLQYSRYLAWLCHWKDALKEQIITQFRDAHFFAHRARQKERPEIQELWDRLTAFPRDRGAAQLLAAKTRDLIIAWEPYSYHSAFRHRISFYAAHPEYFVAMDQAEIPYSIGISLGERRIPEIVGVGPQAEAAKQLYEGIWDKYAHVLLGVEKDDGRFELLQDPPLPLSKRPYSYTLWDYY